METISRSEIIRKIALAIDKGGNTVGEWKNKKDGRIVTVTIAVKDPETFTDAKGVKWVRS